MSVNYVLHNINLNKEECHTVNEIYYRSRCVEGYALYFISCNNFLSGALLIMRYQFHNRREDVFDTFIIWKVLPFWNFIDLDGRTSFTGIVVQRNVLTSSVLRFFIFKIEWVSKIGRKHKQGTCITYSELYVTRCYKFSLYGKSIYLSNYPTVYSRNAWIINDDGIYLHILLIWNKMYTQQ
jgi:hypothetical protein